MAHREGVAIPGIVTGPSTANSSVGLTRSLEVRNCLKKKESVVAFLIVALRLEKTRKCRAHVRQQLIGAQRKIDVLQTVNDLVGLTLDDDSLSNRSIEREAYVDQGL